MRTIAVSTIALVGALAALAEVNAGSAERTTDRVRRYGWIERGGYDREKAERLMLDYVCETWEARKQKKIADEDWVRGFLGVVERQTDELRTPTVPCQFAPSASNHCLRAVKIENGEAVPRCYFAWDGSNEVRRVFRSHQYPRGRFVFGSDYTIWNSRFFVATDDGFDVFKPERTDDGKCYRFRSMIHPDRSFLVQGRRLVGDGGKSRGRILNGK